MGAEGARRAREGVAIMSVQREDETSLIWRIQLLLRSLAAIHEGCLQKATAQEMRAVLGKLRAEARDVLADLDRAEHDPTKETDQ